MSHFLVYVVVPKDNLSEERIEEVMAPYNENMEVPPYKKPCYCVNAQAFNDATNETYKLLGDIDSFRNSFATIKNKLAKKMGLKTESQRTEKYRMENKAKIAKYEKTLDKLWEKHTEPIDRMKKGLLELHPLKDKPDKNCSDCKGTGIQESTYNPNSKWDWYSIGGRWSNAEGDVEANAKQIKKLKKKDVPFAFVDGRGKWYEKGQMGWFGMSANDRESWPKEFSDLLKKENQDDYIVVVDCHI